MDKQFISLLKIIMLVAALAAFYPAVNTYAESPSATSAPVVETPSPPRKDDEPPRKEDDSRLNIRLQTAKKDLGVLPEFAEYFRNSSDKKALEQLQGSLDVYLKRHVDNLLELCTEESTHETIVLAAEVMFLKVRLFMIFNQNKDAINTVADMKRRFASHSDLIVDISGIITTIPAMIQQLDKELLKRPLIDKK